MKIKRDLEIAINRKPKKEEEGTEEEAEEKKNSSADVQKVKDTCFLHLMVFWVYASDVLLEPQNSIV